MKIKRSKGKTILEAGNITLKTNKINRHKFNDLRKLDKITPYDFLRAAGLKKKKKS